MKKTIGSILILLLLAGVFVLPIVTLLGRAHGQYYELIVENYPYMRHFWISMGYAAGITALTVLISIPAAYLFAKVPFRGRDGLFFVYLALMMMPYQVIMAPSYLQMSSFNLLDNPLAIILPAVFQPFCVFLMRQYIRGIPDSLIESARLETNSVLRLFWHVLLPLLKDCVAALAVIVFAESWNMLEQPLIMLETRNKLPLPLILSQISGLPVVFAASVIYLTPVLILLAVTRNRFASGIEVMKR
jgi:multiple sugar transport system permease protein